MKANNNYNPVNLHEFFKIERLHATRKFSIALFRVLLGFIGPLYRCINCIGKNLLKILLSVLARFRAVCFRRPRSAFCSLWAVFSRHPTSLSAGSRSMFGCYTADISPTEHRHNTDVSSTLVLHVVDNTECLDAFHCRSVFFQWSQRDAKISCKLFASFSRLFKYLNSSSLQLILQSVLQSVLLSHRQIIVSFHFHLPPDCAISKK